MVELLISCQFIIRIELIELQLLVKVGFHVDPAPPLTAAASSPRATTRMLRTGSLGSVLLMRMPTRRFSLVSVLVLNANRPGVLLVGPLVKCVETDPVPSYKTTCCPGA